MSFKMTVHWDDGLHEDAELTVRDDLTFRQWREASNQEDTAALQELILDQIESASGYDSVDDMPSTALAEVLRQVGKRLRGENPTSQNAGATRSQRRARDRKKRSLSG